MQQDREALTCSNEEVNAVQIKTYFDLLHGITSVQIPARPVSQMSLTDAGPANCQALVS